MAAILACGLPGKAQIKAGLQDQIREIDQQIGDSVEGAVGNGLVQERARLLAELMQQNPAAAVASALSDELRRTLAQAHPELQPWLEEKGEWSGPLTVTIAEDLRHRRTKTIRMLKVEGRPVTVYWESPADAGCARMATAQGVRLGNRIAAATVRMAADDAAPACTTTGDQKTAVLMVNYKSYSITAGYTQEYLQNAFFGPAPSLNDYWQEASYGVTSASGDVFGPFNLDTDFACDQQEEILQAAIAAADSTVDFTAYSRIFLILPVTVAGGCAYDGLAQVGCSQQLSPSKGQFTASVTWLETPTLGPNIYGTLGQFVQTVIHEGGHNFGLRHANSLDFDTLPVGAVDADGLHTEYGDPFSSMGTNPGHFAAPHKSMLGWLTEGSGFLTVQSAGSWTLAPLSQTTSAPQALRVERGTGTDQWLWIEYRQPIGSYEPTVLDNGGPRDFNGVLVHLEDPQQTANWPAYTNLLTFDPVLLPNDFNQAMLKAGTTWTDPYTNLTLTTGTATPAGIPVTVSYDNGCATLGAPSQAFGPAGGAGQIQVQAPVTCSWTAAAAAEWIAFTGPATGSGSGTVSYTVAPNSGVTARSSFVSISHQSFAVSQQVEVQGGSVAVQPSGGTGPRQTFSFQFTDPTAWSNLTWGEININTGQITANSCYIRWVAAGNQLYLRDDADSTWQGPVAVGAAGALANGQCVVHTDTAILSGSGTTATLSLNVGFTNRFANNQKNVYMHMQSVATAAGWQQAGTWIVNFPFHPLSVIPAAASGTQEVFTFIMAGFYPLSGSYDGDQVNLSLSTSTAFGTLQFYDHGCALVFGPRLTAILFT
jgi:M6 family metalloprotease-like protein